MQINNIVANAEATTAAAVDNADSVIVETTTDTGNPASSVQTTVAITMTGLLAGVRANANLIVGGAVVAAVGAGAYYGYKKYQAHQKTKKPVAEASAA